MRLFDCLLFGIQLLWYLCFTVNSVGLNLILFIVIWRAVYSGGLIYGA